MLTNINAKTLIGYYQLRSTQYHNYLQPHREQLRALATKRFDLKLQREVARRDYNTEQLKYIIEVIFQGAPIGWEWDGQQLKKSSDFV